MIHASAIDLSGREREYINDCLSRGWLTQGKYVRQFEESFAKMSGAKYAIACNSGTSALHLIFLALGIGSRDSVIVPSLTYVATANTARYCGAKVFFADIDRDSWCIDVDAVAELRQRLNPADDYSHLHVVSVDLYDSTAQRFAQADQVVQDSAHNPASKLYGVATAHSFYASKVIACGEGGMITTNDEGLADLVRLYRGQGATITGRYHHSVVGYNYRMTDLQAAIGLAQLERLPEILTRRREIVDRYRSNLDGSNITLQGGGRASAWMCAVLVPENVDRDAIASRLLTNEIETRPFFEPLHTLPMYRNWYAECPVAESVSKRGLCLPTHTLLSNNDVDYVCDQLLLAIRKKAA